MLTINCFENYCLLKYIKTNLYYKQGNCTFLKKCIHSLKNKKYEINSSVFMPRKNALIWIFFVLGASKMRRDLINSEIANLRDLLPLPSSTRQRLSQLQLMALVLVYVRKSNYFDQGNN